MINTIKNLLKKEKTTKVRVIVEYETEYEGHINENDIDFTDIFEPDNIKNVKKHIICVLLMVEKVVRECTTYLKNE